MPAAFSKRLIFGFGLCFLLISLVSFFVVDSETIIRNLKNLNVSAEPVEVFDCEPFVEDEVFVEYMGECVEACMSGTIYVTVERYNECEEHCFPKRSRC